jgi:hypothetical protein
MNGIVIIPTGIGCEIGGHAGDANPVIKLFSTLCNNLITNPNAVNASDINEMTENTLYVEGSILDRFLRGEIYLQKVYRNKILLVVNPPVNINTINSVSAARVTIGIDIDILELSTPLQLIAKFKNGKASGDVIGWDDLIEQVNNYEFDALAIQTLIEVDKEVGEYYLINGGINPWGGVEAKVSKLLADGLDKPLAHSPVDSNLFENFEEIVDPRLAAEVVSVSYLHCILKGLSRAPRINYKFGLSNKDIDFLVTPYGCVGEPHWACIENNIPVICVKENKTCLNDKIPNEFIIVENYLEAAGYISCIKAGISSKSIRRPIRETLILK